MVRRMRPPDRAALRRRTIRRRRATALLVLVGVVAAIIAVTLTVSSGGADKDSGARLVRSVDRFRGLPTQVNIYSHTMAGMLTAVTRRARTRLVTGSTSIRLPTLPPPTRL